MAKEKTTKKKAAKGSAGKKAAATSSANVKTSKNQAAAKAAKPVQAVRESSTTEFNKAVPADKAAVKAAAKVAAKADAATPVGKLIKWHKWLGIIYLLQGMAVLVFGRNVAAPLTLQYPSIDTLASEATGGQVIGLANRHVGDVHLAWVLAVTMVVFAAIHLMMTSAYRAYLETSITRGVNAFRWLSLGLGGGLLVVATALLSGISSIPMLLVLFGSIFSGAMLTLAVETAVANNNGVKSRLSHFLCGLSTLGTLLPWLVFATGVAGVLLWNGKLPTYLYSLYICEAVLVGAFMLATHYRLKRQGKWADGLYSERGYMLLTVVTVTLLSWVIVVGALK